MDRIFWDALLGAVFPGDGDGVLVGWHPGPGMFGIGSCELGSEKEGGRQRRRGSFCFSFKTGWNRSPSFLTRSMTASASKERRSGLDCLAAASTSFHVRGVEIVGDSFAR